MPVNGTELAVGQKWRNRKGDSVIIVSCAQDSTNRWLLSDGMRVNGDGCFWDSEMEDDCDLVEFLLCDPITLAKQSKLWTTPLLDARPTAPIAAYLSGLQVVDAFPEIDLAEDPPIFPESPVGDLASTAKGSGARFNAGKPAFDLVPLRLVAESHLRRGRLSKPQENTIEALFRLAEFQERGKGDLLSIAVLLGLEGWDDCARVLDYGQKKYVAWNWSKGMAWSVPIACAARHLLAMIRGEVNDPESELPHRGHVLANIVMLETYKRTFPEGDDRAPAGYLAPLLEAA